MELNYYLPVLPVFTSQYFLNCLQSPSCGHIVNVIPQCSEASMYTIARYNIALWALVLQWRKAFTFISICWLSAFLKSSLTLVLPSSEEPLSWENLYRHSTICRGGGRIGNWDFLAQWKKKQNNNNNGLLFKTAVLIRPKEGRKQGSGDILRHDGKTV